MATASVVCGLSSASSNANPTLTGGTDSFLFKAPEATLSGNCILIAICYATDLATPTWTITDDKSNSWGTATVTEVDTTNTQGLAIFVLPNVTAGTREYTLAPSANTHFVQVFYREVTNIATTSPVDHSWSTHSSTNTTSWTPGASGALTNATDFIWVVAANTNGSGPFTSSFTVSGGTAPAIFAGELVNCMVDSIDQRTVTTTFTPTITSPTTGAYTSCAVALKTAAAGTAATQDPRILHEQWVDFKDATAANRKTQFVTNGNLQVVSWIGVNAAGTQTRSITAADGVNTFTATAVTGSGTAGGCNYAYSVGSTAGNRIITLTPNATDNISTGLLYDIQATGVSFDKINNDSGNQTSAGNLTAGNITPTNGNGIIIVNLGINAGTVFDTTINDNPHITSENGGGNQLHQDNGFGHIYPTNTSNQSFTWTNSNPVGGVLNWASQSIAFNSAPATTPQGLLQFPAAHPGGPGLTGTLGMAMRAMTKTFVPGTATVLDDPNFPLPLPATHPGQPGLSGTLGMVMRAMPKTSVPGTATVLSDPNPPMLPAGIFPGATGLKGGLNMLMRAMGQMGHIPGAAAPVTVLQRRTFNEFGTHAGGRTIRGD